MQFYALDRKGQIINAKRAKKQCDYLCLECGTHLRVRSGIHRQKHFYHLESIRSCSLRKKGMAHLQLQNHLYELLPSGDCHLEHRFAEINRIADVVWMSKKIVFEIQCSPISAQEIEARNQAYLNFGWRIVWILHDKRYNKQVLSAAEVTLQTQPHYFSNMNAKGEGIIYDQFEIIEKNRRLKRLGMLKIRLDAPKLFLEEQKNHSLALCQRKHLKWPLHFEGDLLDTTNEDYLKNAFMLEKEHARKASKNFWLNSAKQGMKWVAHPYRVLFRYFLEKACR